MLRLHRARIMQFSITPANSAHQLRLAHERMLRRRAAVRTRERIKMLACVAICGGMLAILLTTGFVAGSLPRLSVDAPRGASSDKTANTFAETRTGRILIPMRGGVFCREVLFSNDSGQSGSEKTVLCEQPKPDRSAKGGTSRDLVDALSGGFRKK